MARLRAFVAAFPDAASRERLHQIALALASTASDWRLVAADNYHVTLRFLGDIEAEHVALLREPLARVAERHAPIRARTGRLVALPNPRRPRAVAFEIVSDGTLDALGQDVQAVLEPLHGAADRPFMAHLTVLRSGDRARFRPLPALPPVELDLPSLGLYESDTAPSGAVYTALFEVVFKANERR